MFARVVEFSGAAPDKRDQMLQVVHENVLPMLRQYDGFGGYIVLHDEANDRAKAILLWESREAAESAEETLHDRRRTISAGVGLTIESEDLYEAPVVELEGAPV
jgi:quinol monooxygenase YgiN